MSLLACAYLSVQYLLALGRVSFVFLLAIAAVVEPLLLRDRRGRSSPTWRSGCRGLQLVLAPAVFAIVLRNARRGACGAAVARA